TGAWLRTPRPVRLRSGRAVTGVRAEGGWLRRTAAPRPSRAVARALAVAALLVGCSPPTPDAPDVPCPVEPPGPGEVVVARLCAEAALPDGDGVGADWILANSRFRAV